MGSIRLNGIDELAGGSGTPAASVTDESTYGISPAVGIGADYARDDHTHGSPVAPVTSLAASDAALSLNGATGDITITPADLVGDSGSGGVHGLVPAPAAGDASSSLKFLSAAGVWVHPGDATYAQSPGIQWYNQTISLSQLQALGAVSAGHPASVFSSNGLFCIILAAFLEVVTPLAGGSLSAATASLGTDFSTPTFNDLLVAGDVFTAPAVYGKQSADLGTGLAATTAIQGGIPIIPTDSISLITQVTLVGDTFNHLTAGELKIYVAALFLTHG